MITATEGHSSLQNKIIIAEHYYNSQWAEWTSELNQTVSKIKLQIEYLKPNN